MKLNRILFLMLMSAAMFSCNNEKADTAGGNTDNDSTAAATPRVKEEAVTYQSDTNTFKGYVAFDEAREGKRPVVLVVHEWWGLTDYPRMRAKQLAEMGYFAVAVDMFGNGRIAADPGEAMKYAGPFYQDPNLAKTRLDAALAKAGQYQQADISNAAAIGYCFGGYVVINSAKLGSDLKGVVSFHGSLSGAPANKDLLKAKMLIAHGESDNLVPAAEINAFRKSMDSIGANYSFKTYPNATHAFTNPDASETGKKFNMPIQYNGPADTASWNDMKAFLSGVLK
jgi:dienelactone hydrolase